MTPAVISRLAVEHRTAVSDCDYEIRVAAYKAASADREAFWRGEVIPLPELWTKSHDGWSFWDTICEDETTTLDVGVDLCLTAQHKHRLDVLRRALRLVGPTSA